MFVSKSINTKDFIYSIDNYANHIENSFSSEWNDSVHDSFNQFLLDINKESRSMSDSVSKIPEVLESIAEVSAAELRGKFAELKASLEDK